MDKFKSNKELKFVDISTRECYYYQVAFDKVIQEETRK